MNALSPWTFDRFFEPRWEESAALGEWAPRLDIAETKDAVVVKMEVPGVDPKEIEIKGGASARSIRLPAPVDGSKVAATFKNGLLTVTLPKTPAAKGTTIPIKAA